MATPYQKVYDAFLAKIEEDEWNLETDQLVVEADWRAILEGAIVLFKFPRIALVRDENGFINDLGEDEVQILANLMKEEWLSRTINTWENVKVMYDERDFSQANLLDKLQKMLESEIARAEKMESIYYRSRKGKPFDFSKLASKI